MTTLEEFAKFCFEKIIQHKLNDGHFEKADIDFIQKRLNEFDGDFSQLAQEFQEYKDAE